MRLQLITICLGAASAVPLITSTPPVPSTLNLTAIGAANGESTLECWRLDPLVSSSTPGTAGALALFLGGMANATYTVLPPRFDGGLHNAPALQLVLFSTGLIHITLPNCTEEAWIQGGKYGLIIAADTPDKSAHGHRTEYPGNAATIGLQVPLKNGTKLKHGLLHGGPCTEDEITGF
ncbi:hypothetical protein B0H63DRAFT_103156 [Podospora didyma]|uniref:Small secreted protein n=1 Tax=Podospora didyma TaxID=330526 RepID=A0AAE0U3X3_9PEZI|nr:hypothetical protein B0H63DRAFT_103156 [Podospora didyma]